MDWTTAKPGIYYVRAKELYDQMHLLQKFSMRHRTYLFVDEAPTFFRLFGFQLRADWPETAPTAILNPLELLQRVAVVCLAGAFGQKAAKD